MAATPYDPEISKSRTGSARKLVLPWVFKISDFVSPVNKRLKSKIASSTAVETAWVPRAKARELLNQMEINFSIVRTNVLVLNYPAEQKAIRVRLA